MACAQNQVSIKKLIDKLPITVNGTEKYATGLSKTTTIDEIKYAMLAVSDPKFKPECLNDYGIFEKWQGNERLLDGKIKIHKLIRLWQNLPGDQLSQVQFIIKKRKLSTNYQTTKYTNPSSFRGLSSNNELKFNTISSDFQKKRKNANIKKYFDTSSSDSYPSVLTDSAEEEKRYSSPRRTNKPRKRTSEMKKSFLKLVNKQNEIIDKQLEKIADLDEGLSVKKQNITKNSFLRRSKSSDKCDRKKQLEFEINEDDLSFNESITFLNHAEIKEYAKICTNYFKIQSSLNEKLKLIDDLKTEIKSSKLNKKLLSSIETQQKQNSKIEHLTNALNRMDDIICLKTKFVESLEEELRRLEELVDKNEEQEPTEIKILREIDEKDNCNARKPLTYQYSNSSSNSTLCSSSSSVFTTISSISTSNLVLYQPKPQMTINENKNKIYTSTNDNESDTGISTANSDDFSNQQLETLV